MNKKRILFVGYGIDPNRKEAVSINTIRLMRKLKELGNSVYVANIGYTMKKRKNFFVWPYSMLESVLKRKIIVNDISNIIASEGITHVQDTFVLDKASTMFTGGLIKKFPSVKFIKEVHNDVGFSMAFDLESLIRVFMSRKSDLLKIINSYDVVLSRSKEIASKWKLIYLPPLLEIKYLKRNAKKNKEFRVCYLGHPLKKKGVDVFSRLFYLLPKRLKAQICFTFAFSNLGKKKRLERKLKENSRRAGVRVSFDGIVNPAIFFRENDIFVLPLHDQFGATAVPNTVLEAMEAGCLVITTNTPMMKKIITNGENGILTKKSTALVLKSIIEDICKDKINIELLTRRARRTVVREFTKNKTYRLLKQIYA